MLDPYFDADVYAHVVIAGVTSPGSVTLSGHKRVVGWDVAAAKGQDGATATRKGEDLGKFVATFRLVNDPSKSGDTDFDRWDAFQRLIESSTSGPTPVALSIYHPDLARNHFTEVVLSTMGELVFDGKGGGSIAVELMEYRPPKAKKAAGASGSKTGAGGAGAKGGPDPNDPITQATNQLNDLLNEGKKT